MAKEKTMSPAGRVLDVIGTILIIATIVLCLTLTVPKLFGIQSYTVLTGSMEPNIPVGSLIYVKSVEPELLQPGDVALFYEGVGDVPIAHRVVENVYGESELITKGDANEKNDIAPIPYQNVIGKVLVHIPVLGRILIPLGTLMGKLGMLAIIAAGLLISWIGKLI